MTPGNTPNFSESNIPKPFNFGDNARQKSIHERLKRLVGPGPAAFYKDACRHMAIVPPFEASTHIIGHLVREIESALRDVLESISDQSQFKRQGNEEEKHRQEIMIILRALEIPELDPIAQAWHNLPGKDGLHKRAHRDNLGIARPIDKEFLEFWSQMEVIFDVVLDKFESQYVKVFLLLDALAQKSEPTTKDAKDVHLHVPNNFVAHQRFFNQLESPKWLPLLNAEGLLSEPPKAEKNLEDGGVRHLPWPALVYLEKMTSVSPSLVTEVILNLKETDNSNVKKSLLAITCLLPKENRSSLNEKIKDWLKVDHPFFQFGLIESGSILMIKLAVEGEENLAFEVAKTFLEILPDPQPVEVIENYTPLRNPKMRLETWYYQKFLKEDFQKLVDLHPKKSFELLCDLLVDFRKLEREGKNQDEEEYYEDYSYISRPAIEDHEQNHDRDDVVNLLITAIRNVGLKLISDNPKELKDIVLQLESRKWNVFRRIAMYFLSQFLDTEKDLLAKYLLDEASFDESDFKYEYSRLINKGFKFLTKEQQKIILDRVDQAKKIHEYIHVRKKETSPSAEQEQQYIQTWQRDQLSYIQEDLPDDWKKRYLELVEKFGKSENSEFAARMRSWVGPESEFKSEELAGMEIEELVKLLKNWEPKEKSNEFGPTKEGLARELATVIKAQPEKFKSIAEKFKDLDPTYVRVYLQTFGELIQNGCELDWPQVLDLCLWIIKQPRTIPNRDGKTLDQDPDWGWCRRAIVSLISRGLNGNDVPYEFREMVWQIIEPLTQDPDPTPVDESKREEHSDDAYTSAINSTRGEAMNAVAEYALWTYRSIEQEPDGKEKIKKGFDLMPEARSVFDWHLDPGNDPSSAVHSVYGRFLPWLMLIDKKWVLDHLEMIFPLGKFDDRLYMAAWNTLMLYVPVFNEPFDVLKDRYQEAVINLGKIDKKRTRYTDRDERVVEHLIIQYGRGKIELTDSLLINFWKMADDKLRAHAIGFIGRGLKSEKDVDEELIKRAKNLWESRLAEAKAADNKTSYEEEMSSFGWWFISQKFPDKWLCDQYIEALKIGESMQLDYVVIERLVEISKNLPNETIRILGRLILTDKTNWAVMGNKEEISQIMNTTLNSPEKVAREATTELINRLVSRGYTDFKDLLGKKAIEFKEIKNP